MKESLVGAVASATPSTYTSLHYHLVFSTKGREPRLNGDAGSRLHHYLGGVLRGISAHSHGVGGVADHVHSAVGLKATHCLADVMRELKSESSQWMHAEMKLAGFAWQEGYGAFTFGAQDLEKVRSYVLHQSEHHRVKTFQEE